MGSMDKVPQQVRQAYYALCTPGGMPPLLWGWPGQGKTEIVRQIAGALERFLCEQRFNDKLPEDVSGTPMVIGNAVVRYPAQWVRMLSERCERGEKSLLFIDEATTCRQDVQAPLLAGIRDLMFGDVKLDAELVKVMVAANPVELAANGTEIAHALNNRVDHVPFSPFTHDVWVDYMLSGHSVAQDLKPFDRPEWERNFPTALARVCAFIQARPSMLAEDPAKAEGRDYNQFSSPRSVEAWARKYATLLTFDDEASITVAARGLCGEPFALEFGTWIRDMDLPNGDDVLTGKVKLVARNKADLDSNGKPKAGQCILDERRPDRIYAILTSVAVAATQVRPEKEFAARWEAAWENAIKPCMEYGKDQVVVSARLLANKRPKGAVLKPAVQTIIRELSGVVREAGLIAKA